MHSGDGKDNPDVSTGHASTLDTSLGSIETADVLHKKYSHSARVT